MDILKMINVLSNPYHIKLRSSNLLHIKSKWIICIFLLYALINGNDVNKTTRNKNNHYYCVLNINFDCHVWSLASRIPIYPVIPLEWKFESKHSRRIMESDEKFNPFTNNKSILIMKHPINSSWLIKYSWH